MNIAIASDHAGFALKEKLIPFLRELGHTVTDYGASTYEEFDDYPNFIVPAAQAVSKDPTMTRGVIIGGSGQGEAMCANRFKNVRAAVYYGGPKEIVTLSREHNDANILSLGARFLDETVAKEIVQLWLTTSVSDDPKYARRIQMVEKLSDTAPI